MSTGETNSILDIGGVELGNAHDAGLKSGITVLMCENPMTCSVAVHGGGPGTRDVALLEPENSVDGVDALVLSGGSAFGLDAASGVQSYLREIGRGFKVGPVSVPIVPAAIIFDLINGGNKDWGLHAPYRDLGYEAARAASQAAVCGTHGAGTGALVAELKGGLGTASTMLDDGLVLGALVVVNALGSPLIGNSRHFHAAIFENEREFGGFGLPTEMPAEPDALNIKFRERASGVSNTTIAIVGTNAVLDKSQCKRLAVAAHDGLARAIWPAHTPLDGDLVFGLSSGKSGIKPTMDQWIDIGAHAASTLSRAVARAIYSADPADGDLFPTYKNRFDLS